MKINILIKNYATTLATNIKNIFVRRLIDLIE